MTVATLTLVDMTTKRCPRCEQTKPVEEFTTTRHKKDGRHTYCRPCAAEYATARNRSDPERARAYRNEWSRRNPEKRKQYRRRFVLGQYGLTVEEYDQMLERQNGLCAICELGPPKGKPMLYVDHCHDSGNVRELLCARCNFALGLLDDDVVRVHRIAAYLLRHRTPNLKLEVN